MRRRAIAVAAVAAGSAAAALLLVAACARQAGTAPGGEPVAAPWLNHDPAVAYVGQDGCRPCHREIDASYRQTGMGRAFYPLTEDNAVEDWTDDNEFVDPASGVRYRMERRDDGTFWQREFVLDSRGREVAVEEHRIVWVVGSNNHSRSYISLVDGKWFQPPICWYPQGELWDLCPGYEMKNLHFSREITESCMLCHNGRMEPVEGVRNAFREPLPHGIGCERCHGPGELHVERWTSGEAPTGEPDRTIVNPRHLPRKERIEVCYQCHLGDSSASERVARHGRDASSFRPGQSIGEMKVSFRFAERVRSKFGLSSQADRLILSRCYEASGGEIECLTCHNPHVSVYSPDRPAEHFRQACLSCHQAGDCVAPAAERQATAGLADDCVACHMRRAEPHDQRFTEFTDHWIRRDIRAGADDERQSIEIEPIDPQLLASFPVGEQAYYRGRAYHLMAGKVPHEERAPYHREALAAYQRAIDEGFDVADAWYYLGKIREETRDARGALEAFQTAVEREPSHYDGRFAVGQTLAALGRVEPARAVYEALLSDHPDDPMVLSEAGRLWFQAGERQRALDAFERAVELEPWNATLHLNRGMILAAAGRFDDSAAAAEEAVRRDPDNPKLWSFYTRVMQEAGRPRLAAEGRHQLARLEAAHRARSEPHGFAGAMMGGTPR